MESRKKRRPQSKPGPKMSRKIPSAAVGAFGFVPMVPVIQADQKDAESDQGRQNPNEVSAHLSLLVRYMQPARQAAPMRTPRTFSWKTPTARRPR